MLLTVLSNLLRLIAIIYNLQRIAIAGWLPIRAQTAVRTARPSAGSRPAWKATSRSTVAPLTPDQPPMQAVPFVCGWATFRQRTGRRERDARAGNLGSARHHRSAEGAATLSCSDAAPRLVWSHGGPRHVTVSAGRLGRSG